MVAEQRSVVVTGVSSGIGRATTKVLLDKGLRVFGTVRQQHDVDRLPREFPHDFVPLIADVTDEAAVNTAVARVGDMIVGEHLAGLVNNAGIVVAGPLLHLDASDMRRQMEANVIGPMIVTKAFAPLLGSVSGRTGKPGRIVQISSVSGVLGFPLIGPYTASKFALEGMSESLRRELMMYGIDVVVLEPGAVRTAAVVKSAGEEFYDTDYGPVLRGFQAFFNEQMKTAMEPEVIGQAVYRALTDAKPKARYAVVPQRLKNWTLPKLLPTRMLDRLIAKQFGLGSRVTFPQTNDQRDGRGRSH